ncbi:MAG TPA: hypothetical protein VF100_10730 [Thermoanaerobaculia bacterium]
MNAFDALLRRTTFLGAAAVLVAVPAAEAQQIRVATAPARVTAAATAACAGGLVNDDGSFEGVGSFFLEDRPAAFDAVMLFHGPGAGRRLEQVCICWDRLPQAAGTLAHQIVLFRADGPGGSPGSQPVAVLDAVAQGIGTTATILGYDVSGESVLTPAADFYLGVRWNAGFGDDPDAYSLCFDDSSPPVHPKFVKEASEGEWTDIDELFSRVGFPPIRALGIRAELAAPQQPPPPPTCPIGACVEDDETICLDGGRFEVKVDFDPPNDDDALTEPARAERLTADTGYFTFFDPNNVEAVIKVLDACPVNDHHWVFAGGLTNVLTEITVCDKANGVQRKYTNPQGTPFQPIQDTAAFATCP